MYVCMYGIIYALIYAPMPDGPYVTLTSVCSYTRRFDRILLFPLLLVAVSWNGVDTPDRTMYA